MIQKLIQIFKRDRDNEQKARDQLDELDRRIEKLLRRTSYGYYLFKKREHAILVKEEMREKAKASDLLLRETCIEMAQSRRIAGEKWDGKWIHPDIAIIKKTELKITDLPQAVAFLVQSGKGDIVSIKLHGSTGFFKNSVLPPAIQLVHVPGVRISSK
jgi:hypothetical protein